MKKNLNSPSKIKQKVKGGKFNIIDFLLIAIVLLIIGTLIYVFLPSSAMRSITADKKVDIDYAIEIIGVDEEFIDNIKQDDVVLDSISKNQLGTVTAVDYSIQYTELKYSEEEEVGVLSPVLGKYNVIVTVSATAEYEEGIGYSVNGTRIAVGEKISARFPDYVCEGYCISIPLD